MISAFCSWSWDLEMIPPLEATCLFARYTLACLDKVKHCASLKFWDKLNMPISYAALTFSLKKF